jgi:hypothetical protein
VASAASGTRSTRGPARSARVRRLRVPSDGRGDTLARDPRQGSHPSPCDAAWSVLLGQRAVRETRVQREPARPAFVDPPWTRQNTPGPMRKLAITACARCGEPQGAGKGGSAASHPVRLSRELFSRRGHPHVAGSLARSGKEPSKTTPVHIWAALAMDLRSCQDAMGRAARETMFRLRSIKNSGAGSTAGGKPTS